MRADSALYMHLDAVEAPTSSVAFHYSFEADPLSVRTALFDTLGWLGCQLSEDDAGNLELVLAEIFNNIVEHGYKETGRGTIVLSIYPQNDSLLCSVGDASPALPDTCLQFLECQRPVPENLPEGGFGWYLVRDLVQDLEYKRENGRNQLWFRLPLSREPIRELFPLR